MAQHQYSIPSGPSLAHPQSTPSPGNSQAFPLPPNKRQRLSPDVRPQSPLPYVQHQLSYGASPNAGTPTSTSASPHFGNISLPTPNLYNTPYGNGATTPTPSTPTLNLPTHLPRDPPSNLPHNHPLAQVPVRDLHQTPNGTFNTPQNSNHFQNNLNNTPPTGAGMMGPPSKPVDRDSANDDQMDVLANAGVNLRAEEDFAMSFHTNSLSSQPAFSQPGPNPTGHAFTQFAPGDSNTFFGAGPANQSGQIVNEATQEALEKQAADKAWAEAALRTARSRQHELTHPHVNVEAVWKRIDRIARDNGVGLSTTEQGKLPVLRMEHEFRSDVTVQTAPGPNGAMMVTSGYFVPADSPLTDQLALLSLATHLRLRVILEEAFTLASRRRTDSHGVVPTEWADVSAPAHVGSGTIVAEGAIRSGWESAVSPRTNPIKTSLSSTNLLSVTRLPTPVSDGPKTPGGVQANGVVYSNELIKWMREDAKKERDFEEERLRKRATRLVSQGTLGQGSTATGTPGSVAPEPTGKPLTKKEREKQISAKQNLVDSHAQANATTQQFLFGGRSKKKTYSWMTGGGGGSGASTPSRINTQGLPGTPGAVTEKVMLTGEGTNRAGSFREDSIFKGSGVELRDMMNVLEKDKRAPLNLMKVKMSLEPSTFTFYQRERKA